MACDTLSAQSSLDRNAKVFVTSHCFRHEWDRHQKHCHPHHLQMALEEHCPLPKGMVHQSNRPGTELATAHARQHGTANHSSTNTQAPGTPSGDLLCSSEMLLVLTQEVHSEMCQIYRENEVARVGVEPRNGD